MAHVTVTIIVESWWLLMAGCQFGASTSANNVMTWPDRRKDVLAAKSNHVGRSFIMLFTCPMCRTACLLTPVILTFSIGVKWTPVSRPSGHDCISQKIINASCVVRVNEVVCWELHGKRAVQNIHVRMFVCVCGHVFWWYERYLERVPIRLEILFVGASHTECGALIEHGFVCFEPVLNWKKSIKSTHI